MVRGDDTIFLVGFMGSGKSTAGALLAAEIGWSFVDTDLVVERSDGRPIERIFRESGEGRFRELEWEALTGLVPRGRKVVATGGGLFLGALQRRWIRQRGRSVWLDLPLAECRRRVGRGSGRPLWREDPVTLRAIFERRRAAYALAQVRLDVRSAPPEEVVRRLRDCF